MTSAEQRRLLGQFIRSHRERMVPDAPTGRRRTPGLRREELAARAGIGSTWCAWIEQGRDVSVSAQALARLAVALALTSAERGYLFELAGRLDPSAAQPVLAFEAPASLRALVDAVCHPAYGLDRLWNACCWNAPAERLFGGWLGKGREKNLLRYAFTEPAARMLLPDWENRVIRLLAEFRADYGRSLNDPRTRALVDQLKSESELFARAWDLQDVVAREGGERSFSHPERGLVLYHQHTFSPADRPDHKLVVLIPDSERRDQLPQSTTSI
jgi:transcriptional regulator with XRE-family HTH domain